MLCDVRLGECLCLTPSPQLSHDASACILHCCPNRRPTTVRLPVLMMTTMMMSQHPHQPRQHQLAGPLQLQGVVRGGVVLQQQEVVARAPRMLPHARLSSGRRSCWRKLRWVSQHTGSLLGHGAMADTQGQPCATMLLSAGTTPQVVTLLPLLLSLLLATSKSSIMLSMLKTMMHVDGLCGTENCMPSQRLHA